MNFFNLILGILLILIGVLLIHLYNYLVKEEKSSGLSFKFRTGGIGFIMIGIALIIRELKNI